MKYLFFLIAFVPLRGSFGQTVELKSAKHGIDLIYDSNVSKEELLADVRFEGGGKDDMVDLLRFDKLWGPGVLPLIISSKMPVLSDSFGLAAVKLDQQSLKKVVRIVDECNTNISRRPAVDGWLFRITYRFGGMSHQYFVTDQNSPVAYFRRIETVLVKIDDRQALDEFYLFLKASEFLTFENDGTPVWID